MGQVMNTKQAYTEAYRFYRLMNWRDNRYNSARNGYITAPLQAEEQLALTGLWRDTYLDDICDAAWDHFVARENAEVLVSFFTSHLQARLWTQSKESRKCHLPVIKKIIIDHYRSK